MSVTCLRSQKLSPFQGGRVLRGLVWGSYVLVNLLQVVKRTNTHTPWGHSRTKKKKTCLRNMEIRGLPHRTAGVAVVELTNNDVPVRLSSPSEWSYPFVVYCSQVISRVYFFLGLWGIEAWSGLPSGRLLRGHASGDGDVYIIFKLIAAHA